MLKRYCYFSLLIFTFSLFIPMSSSAQSSMLTEGADAPLFTAQATQDGNVTEFSLEKALNDGPVVLYFFPAAYTSGCDLQARTFAKHEAKFDSADATIIGMSAGSIERLKSFSADPDFCAGKFPVASDPKGEIAGTFGLEIIPPRDGATDNRGKEINHGFIPRTTFVINKDGTIAATLSSKEDDLAPDEHVTKALEVVKGL